nr:hypothetical protein C4D60_Mb04t39460 [Ipomoea batatas]GMC52593.1 hypothetical protein C4D60_Mb04t39460 [Ipomoea batatas]GMC54548.1 hypothetical protein C4D60_Mb04t39460 [Ipomoea batatas]
MVKTYFFLDTMYPKQRQAESLKEMQEALGWKNGLHCSRKSKFRIVGITISSSSLSRGVAGTDADEEPAIGAKEGDWKVGHRAREVEEI